MSGALASVGGDRPHSTNVFYGTWVAYEQECASATLVRRVRTFSQDQPSDVHYALSLLSRMRDVAVVVHGPRGCFSRLPRDSHDGGAGGRWALTDLSERDVIMGGEAKLRRTIRRLHETSGATRILVLTTPLVSINGDDTEAVADELRKELGIVIELVPTTGFLQGEGVFGYDEALTALTACLLPRPAQVPPPGGLGAGPYVNLLSVSESQDELSEMGQFLNALGFSVNLLPNWAEERQFRLAPGARASVVLNPDESGVLADLLQERYHVPVIAPDAPVGFRSTALWRRAVADALGVPWHDAGGGAAGDVGSDVPASAGDCLRGLRVYLQVAPVYAAACVRFLESCGADVCGVTLPYLDARAVRRAQGEDLLGPDRFVHVAEGQSFELDNLLRRLTPDVLLTQGDGAACALRAGIPVVSLAESGLLGRTAASRILGRVRRAWKSPSLFCRLALGQESSYSASWQRKSTDWYIKQRVRG